MIYQLRVFAPKKAMPSKPARISNEQEMALCENLSVYAGFCNKTVLVVEPCEKEFLA